MDVSNKEFLPNDVQHYQLNTPKKLKENWQTFGQDKKEPLKPGFN